ncbi:hypothetical protein LOK49_LG03G02192 [Camellia lanceoleosa]|uniref:Uncharacterized protein n=1 Tax=Camellia lanceoleosa TaxID=1840588 RepID=A0ACC0I902_9ERIC|nr:hypothetical protein LOK49_LG03G02192 [Camellia lanceoleosa]
MRGCWWRKVWRLEWREVKMGRLVGMNDIALCLRKAMASKEEDEMRTHVEKTAAIFRDRKLHDQYAVEYIKNGREGENESNEEERRLG